MPQSKVWIVGAGAIGQLYGYYLSQQSQVSLFGRYGQPLEKELTFYPQGNNSPQRWRGISPEEGLGPQDLLMICCKSYQTASGYHAISHRISSTTPILLMQNGMGSEAELDNCPNPVLKASITHGALRTVDGAVRHTGTGSTELGLLSGKLTDLKKTSLSKLLHSALPPAKWDPEINSSLWKKLLIKRCY